MANAINTNSTLTLGNGLNKTSTGLSTNIIILVGTLPVGAIQSISVNESRPIIQIKEVGTDGIIDSVPNGATTISGSCTRIRFDRLRLAEAFGRGFLHLASQQYAFDITLIDRQKENTASQIVTTIKNVWFESLNYSLSADNYLISETSNWKAETIYSVLGGGGATPAAVGGERGITYYNNRIERATDTGKRRGSMDASGLIDIGSSFDTASVNQLF